MGGQGWESVMWSRLVWARGLGANPSSHQLRREERRAGISISSPVDALLTTLASVTARVSLGLSQSSSSFNLPQSSGFRNPSTVRKSPETGHVAPLPQDTVPTGYTWLAYFYLPC